MGTLSVKATVLRLFKKWIKLLSLTNNISKPGYQNILDSINQLQTLLLDKQSVGTKQKTNYNYTCDVGIARKRLEQVIQSHKYFSDSNNFNARKQDYKLFELLFKILFELEKYKSK